MCLAVAAPAAGSSSVLQPEAPLATQQPVAPHVLGVVFPGFHKDEVNDYVWGDNFTEWWRVDDGEALLPGQHQPQIPRDRYDLSEPDALKRMATMARANGVDSLLMYHCTAEHDASTRVPLPEALPTPRRSALTEYCPRPIPCACPSPAQTGFAQPPG